MSNSHSSAGAMAGYLTQARLALLEGLRALRKRSLGSICIEETDDFSIHHPNNMTTQFQSKHHKQSSKKLTDSSIDLWKTLQIWIEQVNDDSSILDTNCFVLLTTQQVGNDSAVSILCQDNNNKSKLGSVEQKLIKITENSKNCQLSSAFDLFNKLKKWKRIKLLSRIKICCEISQIDGLEANIEEEIYHLVQDDQLADARIKLEGWWWSRICQLLNENKDRSISLIEIRRKRDEIRWEYNPNNLPLSDISVEPTEDELHDEDNRIYIKQLNLIDSKSAVIKNAKRDHILTVNHRFKWARLNVGFDNEIEEFEKQLKYEWRAKFDVMREDLEGEISDTIIKRKGEELFNLVMKMKGFSIRNRSEDFLIRGSFHMLSDQKHVGWHRDYISLLSTLK